MLRIFRRGEAAFDQPLCGADWTLPQDAVWLDFLDPSREEELAVERQLGLSLPTREDMNAIEPSSRLYQENGATFITAFVLIGADTDRPDTTPITFVLTSDRLITIRYGNPSSFRIFTGKVERAPSLCATGADTFLNLLEAVIDRTSNVLERVGEEVDAISNAIFAQPRVGSFDTCLYKLGRSQTTNAEIRHSLSSLSRATSFATLAGPVEASRDHRDHLRTINRDVVSLSQQSDALSSNIGFLLNAALGLINIEQSNIIKIFSIAAVVLLPPTLVASVYGMNFDFMPELHWRFGYPFALVLMAVSVGVTLWYFKRKRWL